VTGPVWNPMAQQYEPKASRPALIPDDELRKILIDAAERLHAPEPLTDEQRAQIESAIKRRHA
jgi:hypothetical protein